jgi:hypothetical protein
MDAQAKDSKCYLEILADSASPAYANFRSPMFPKVRNTPRRARKKTTRTPSPYFLDALFSFCAFSEAIRASS